MLLKYYRIYCYPVYIEVPNREKMDHKIAQHRFENGINLIMVPLENTMAVTSIVLFGVGSRYENESQLGLAHFTEHMVFKGGKKYQTTQMISQALDSVGGEFNAYTSQEFTGFYTKTAAAHLELGLDVLSDMVIHPTFPADELEKEKGVIVEELNMYEDMPMQKVDQIFNLLAFGDTPLGRPIIGQKDSVRAFTTQSFQDYKDTYYTGSRCTIVVAGSFNQDEVINQIETLFGSMSKGLEIKPVEGVYQIRESIGRVALETKKSEQTHLIMSVKGFAADNKDRFVLKLLSTILGGNMSSRLFVSVREEQGLCYYVRSGVDSYTDVGLLVASAGVDNNRLEQAVAAIVKEMKKLKREIISQEELDRSKQYLLGKLLLSIEDSEHVAEMYGMQYLMKGRLEAISEIEEGINKVSTDDVYRITNQLFQDEWLRLAVIGPFEDAQKLNDLLTFNN